MEPADEQAIDTKRGEMILAVENVFTKVVSTNKDVHDEIFNYLSYPITGAKHIERKLRRKYKNPNFELKKVNSFYDYRYQVFLTGFLERVQTHLVAMAIPFEVIDKRSNPLERPITDVPTLNGITLWDYQERSFEAFMKAKRGVAKIATGGGKTEIFIALAKALRLPTLFMTHRVNLISQTARRFIERVPELKDHIGIIGDSIYEPKLITLATVQTLYSMMKRHPGPTKDLLSWFRFLCIDEAHRSGASQFHLPAIYCKNAYYRLALTATPFMKGNVQDDMYLMGISGGIFSTVSNGELIERGILAKPFFTFFKITEPNLWRKWNWRDVYEEGIIYNARRNNIIATQARKLADMKRKTLIIVQEVLHGRLLEELLKEQKIKVRYMDGKDNYRERERGLKLLSTGEIETIIATNIFDEGIDVEDINAIILAAGTKSAPALFQRTGRAIRRKPEENYAIILDFIDDTNRHLLSHSLHRHNLIKAENGFTILS